MITELWLETMMLSEQPGANRGPSLSVSITSTFNTVAAVVIPSVTEISILSSDVDEPSWMYCRAFLVISSYVKVSPSQKERLKSGVVFFKRELCDPMKSLGQ